MTRWAAENITLAKMVRLASIRSPRNLFARILVARMIEEFQKYVNVLNNVGFVISPKLKEGLSLVSGPEAARINLISRLPSGELIQVGQISALVYMFTGISSRSFTGANLQCDGGVTELPVSE